MAIESRSTIWTDHAGRQTILRTVTNGGAGGIQSALLAQSNGDFLEFWESVLTINATPTTVNAAYPGITQQAVLTFLCSDGSIARVRLPAPKLGIFLPDGQSVDSTMIGAIIAACVGVLASPSNATATSFLGGFLEGRRASF